MRQNSGKAIGHHCARAGAAARTRWQAGDHQHQTLGLERRSFVYGVHVVVNGRLSSCAVGGRKHAAATITCDAHPVRIDDAHRFREPKRGYLVAPGIDSRNTKLRTGFDGFT